MILAELMVVSKSVSIEVRNHHNRLLWTTIFPVECTLEEIMSRVIDRIESSDDFDICVYLAPKTDDEELKDLIKKITKQ